jgi:hypothetical protein
VTVRVDIDGGETVHLAVGPFDREALTDELDRETPDGLSVRRVLETVADELDLSEQAHGSWVLLTKRVERADG